MLNGLKNEKRTTMKLVPYRIIPDKDHYIVEHVTTGEFYEMPQPAIEAMEALEKGVAPEQIELELLRKFPEEEINIVDFLAQLEEMGFLVDSKQYPIEREVELERADNSQAVINSTTGKFLFRKESMPVYIVFFCANIMICMSHPDLFPRPHDLFPFDSMVINMIVSLLVSVLLLAIHETGHVIAARAAGLSPSISIGHRLFLPVIETQMPTIWRLSRGKRNIPLLAGLFMDHTLLFFSLIALLFVPLSVTITGILGIIVLQLTMMSLYQCMFFMKTDLYYIVQNATGSYNLMENAEGWLKETILLSRQKNTTTVYEKERIIVRSYAMFYVIGVLFSLALFVIYVIPQLLYSFNISFDRLGTSSSAAMKADAIVFFVQLLVYISLLMYSWSKKFTRVGQ